MVFTAVPVTVKLLNVLAPAIVGFPVKPVYVTLLNVFPPPWKVPPPVNVIVEVLLLNVKPAGFVRSNAVPLRLNVMEDAPRVNVLVFPLVEEMAVAVIVCPVVSRTPLVNVIDDVLVNVSASWNVPPTPSIVIVPPKPTPLLVIVSVPLVALKVIAPV